MNHWRQMRSMAALIVMLIVLGGCKDDAPVTADKAAQGATAEKKEALKPQSDLLFKSVEVLGYGGFKSLAALKTMATDMMTKFQFLPAAAVPSMIDESLKSQMQVTSLEWMDSERPMAVVVTSATQNKNGGLVCVPLKDKALFEKSVPANAEKGKDGNAIALTGAMGGSLFVNFIAETHAVFTEDAALFGKFKDLLIADLPRLKYEKTIELNLSGEGLRGTFEGEIKELKAELERELESDEAKEQMASAGLTKEQVQKLLAMTEELRSGQVAFEVVDGHFLVSAELGATSGSLAGKLFKLFSAKVDTGLLSTLPANAFVKMASVVSNDGGEFAKLIGWDASSQSAMKNMFEVGGEVFEISAEDKAKIEKLNDEYQAALGDNSSNVFGVYKSEAFPLSMIVMSDGVKDGPAADKASRELMKLVWKFTAEAIKKEMGGSLPPGVTIDANSFSKTWKGLSPMAAPFGVTMRNTVHAGTDGVTVDGVGLSVKYEALPTYAENKGELDMVKGLVGDDLEVAMGMAKDRSAVGLGPKATDELRAILTASAAPVGDELKGFLSRGQERASSFVYVNPIEFLRQFSNLQMPEARALQGLSTVQKGEGLAVTYGSSKTDTVGMTLDISLSDAAAIIKAFNLSPM